MQKQKFLIHTQISIFYSGVTKLTRTECKKKAKSRRLWHMVYKVLAICTHLRVPFWEQKVCTLRGFCDLDIKKSSKSGDIVPDTRHNVALFKKSEHCVQYSQQPPSASWGRSRKITFTEYFRLLIFFALWWTPDEYRTCPQSECTSKCMMPLSQSSTKYTLDPRFDLQH